jgi:hypothetical protein
MAGAVCILLAVFCCAVVLWVKGRGTRGSLWVPRRRAAVETVAAAASPRVTSCRVLGLTCLSLAVLFAFLMIPQIQRAVGGAGDAVALVHGQATRMADAANNTSTDLRAISCPANASTVASISCDDILAECANATNVLDEMAASLRSVALDLRTVDTTSLPAAHWATLFAVALLAGAAVGAVVHSCYWGRNGQGPTVCTRLTVLTVLALLASLVLAPTAAVSGLLADGCPLSASTIAVAADLDAADTSLVLYYMECKAATLPPSSDLARFRDELEGTLIPAMAQLIAWANSTDPTLTPVFETDAMYLASAALHLDSLADCEETAEATAAARVALCRQTLASLPSLSLCLGLALSLTSLIGLAAAEADRRAAHASLARGIGARRRHDAAWRAGETSSTFSADEELEGGDHPPLVPFGTEVEPLITSVGMGKASYDTFGTDETWDEGSFRK